MAFNYQANSLTYTNTLKALKLLSQTTIFITFVLAVCFSNIAYSETVKLAIASNFISAAKALISDFQSTNEIKLRASYASSGKLAAQIIHGAPYDIFLSADQKTPDRLISQGYAKSNSRFTYAVGQLSLCTSRPTQEKLPLKALLQRGHRIALANEKLAPYGRAARQVLDALAINETRARPWIRGENVAQAFQFLVSTNVDLAFVAYSQTLNSTHLQSSQCILIPDELYQPIYQDAILLKGTGNAISVLEYLKSNRAQKIIEAHGYKSKPYALLNSSN